MHVYGFERRAQLRETFVDQLARQPAFFPLELTLDPKEVLLADDFHVALSFPRGPRFIVVVSPSRPLGLAAPRPQ
jgi:hypothetical protein